MFVVSLALVALTLVYGAEVKGARRWIVILRPSTSAAGSSSARIRDPDRPALCANRRGGRKCRPANTLALGLLGLVASLLVPQPDFGQTMLIALAWGALFFMAGMRMIWVCRGRRHCRSGSPAPTRVPHMAQAHRPLPRSRLRRHLQRRPGDRVVPAWRLVRSRPRRRHGQAHPARGSHRFRVRRRGRGIRHRALPHAGAALRLHRAPGALRHEARCTTEDPFRSASGCRLLFIRHQHGGQSASDAGQRHDAAVYLLRRVFDDLARLGHGHAACFDPRKAARRAFGRGEPRTGRESSLMNAPAAPLVLLAAGGTGGICSRPSAGTRSRAAGSPSSSRPITGRNATAPNFRRARRTLSRATRCARAIHCRLHAAR